MSEMIERVARAIEREIDPLTSIDPSAKTYSSIMSVAARSAIESMREPTQEMEWAATGRTQARDESLYGSVYRAMIDEALGSKVGCPLSPSVNSSHKAAKRTK